VGHRAHFVVIRDGGARAYVDQWAALGSTYCFADGPAEATTTVESTATETAELLDWAFAEAGYLIDYDEKSAIVFGSPMPFDPEELGDGIADSNSLADLDQALEEGPLPFLQLIAPRWKGWQLCWDDRGVDAFGEHLKRRGITSVSVQPPSHPQTRTRVSLQA